MDDAEGNHVEPAITLLALNRDDDDDNDDNDGDDDNDDDVFLKRITWGGEGMYGGVLTSDHGSKVAWDICTVCSAQCSVVLGA